MAGFEARASGRLTMLVRRGPLPGAGTWTHEYGDSANTGVSADSLVRAPLGILWFGGLSNEKTLPRHSHGPSEEVIGGRVFMEGPDLMRALDVYTGRLLWQTDLLGVGRYYDHTLHAPGANALGTNFVATADSLYVVHNGRCVQLDTATGRQVRQFTSTAPAPAPISPRVNTRRVPASDATTDPDSAVATAPEWSYIAVWEDLLIGGASPVEFSTADFTAGERPFRIRDDKGKLHDPKEVKKVTDLVEEIKQWRDFQFQEPPETVFTSSSASDPTKPPKVRTTDEGDWAVVNLNHMLRQRNVLARLPVRIVQAARQSYGDRIKKWEDEADKAAEKGDSYETPEPADIEEVQAGVMAHLTDTHDPARGGAADQDLQWLNRKLLEVCYSTLPKAERMRIGQYSLDHTASRMIVVRDRRTGVALWSRQAASSFIHNAIAVGGGVLFCIDRTPLAETNRLLYRGVKPAAPAMILALDVRTGKELWHTGKDVFGTWLSYSAAHDVLVQAGRPSRDMLADEVDSRLIAFQGTTGKVLWDKKDKYDGPILLHDAKVITQKTAVNLLTGKTVDRVHPLTGENSKWEIKRYHGCGTAIGSTNLLTFPSAGAGFFDLANDGGTGNLGGFKSGCTASLIVADGVLNSPDYTRNCTCSYQNRTSLAMVHMPDVEMWTFQHFDRGKGHVRQVGVNFGAPGDRRAEATPGSGTKAGAATGAKAGATPGTLWLEYPIVGGPGPKLDIAVEPTEPNQPDSVTWFRHHISQACGDGPPWVIASGMEGATQVSIRMEDVKDAKERTYTVSLYFAEPGPAKAGQRVFDVAIQDKTVLKDFDVMAQTRRPLSGLVRTFRGVKVVSLLTIRLTPSPSAAVPRSVLCGVEVVEEKKE
jgi:outer membrane protein assembly factor BamB